MYPPLLPSHLILITSGNASPVLEPLLVHLRRIAGTLVRNAATLGGNIVLARLKVPPPCSLLKMRKNEEEDTSRQPHAGVAYRAASNKLIE
jgi:CO/xanthine dehydrogenase FAD-binding subunit